MKVNCSLSTFLIYGLEITSSNSEIDWQFDIPSGKREVIQKAENNLKEINEVNTSMEDSKLGQQDLQNYETPNKIRSTNEKGSGSQNELRKKIEVDSWGKHEGLLEMNELDISEMNEDDLKVVEGEEKKKSQLEKVELLLSDEEKSPEGRRQEKEESTEDIITFSLAEGKMGKWKLQKEPPLSPSTTEPRLTAEDKDKIFQVLYTDLLSSTIQHLFPQRPSQLFSHAQAQNMIQAIPQIILSPSQQQDFHNNQLREREHPQFQSAPPIGMHLAVFCFYLLFLLVEEDSTENSLQSPQQLFLQSLAIGRKKGIKTDLNYINNYLDEIFAEIFGNI